LTVSKNNREIAMQAHVIEQFLADTRRYLAG
jgi:hypothetical protein